MPTVFILSGLPYAGKSTFAKSVEEKTMIKRISFDDLWASFVQVDENISYEKMIAEIKKLIDKQLEKGYSVIYDSTNLKEEHRKEIIDIAKNHDVEAVVVYFSITEQEMRRRIEQSLVDKSHHIVDEDNIQKALEHNQVPSECIIVNSEEIKEKLLEELVKNFPKE